MDAVVAVYEDWGIGRDGTQPVVVPEDRRHFREITGSGTVIVGRRTLGDFPGGRPLKGRRNIVLTRQLAEIPGAEIARSPEEAVELARGEEQVFVIGGESVYRTMLPWLDRVYVTKIHARPESDAFFPELDGDAQWRVTARSGLRSSGGLEYEFLTYERKPSC